MLQRFSYQREKKLVEVLSYYFEIFAAGVDFFDLRRDTVVNYFPKRSRVVFMFLDFMGNMIFFSLSEYRLKSVSGILKNAPVVSSVEKTAM